MVCLALTAPDPVAVLSAVGVVPPLALRGLEHLRVHPGPVRARIESSRSGEPRAWGFGPVPLVPGASVFQTDLIMWTPQADHPPGAAPRPGTRVVRVSALRGRRGHAGRITFPDLAGGLEGTVLLL